MIPIEQVVTERFAMRYFRFGSGQKTLVILPGLSVTSVMDVSEAVAASYVRMKEDYTIYVFDRREDLPPAYSVREMAEDTADAFRALGLSGVDLFGASQGGMMAIVIAIEYPELVHKMVLGSTTSHLQDAQWQVLEGWINLARKKDREGLYFDFGRKLYPPELFEEYRDALTAASRDVTDADLARFVILAEGAKGFNVTDQLDRISCPVLAIGSFTDEVLDCDATMEIAERLDVRPDFRLFLYAGYGHAAYDTAPDYRERVLRFLREE